MPEEYENQDFPEMEPSGDEMGDLPEEAWEDVPNDEVADLQRGEIDVPDELQEQVDPELVESYSDAQDAIAPEYPPREAPKAMSQDSGGTLFSPDDDPIQQPLISNPLDPRLVYTRPVPRRLRHLTCERRGAEYNRPSGLYRPGG